jgi:hypothetical protein
VDGVKVIVKVSNDPEARTLPSDAPVTVKFGLVEPEPSATEMVPMYMGEFERLAARKTRLIELPTGASAN